MGRTDENSQIFKIYEEGVCLMKIRQKYEGNNNLTTLFSVF